MARVKWEENASAHSPFLAVHFYTSRPPLFRRHASRYKTEYGLPCANLDYVINRYHLHEKLGEGSYGRVYKGFDDSLGPFVPSWWAIAQHNEYTCTTMGPAARCNEMCQMCRRH